MSVIRPSEVFDEIHKVVVGQEEAIREVSVAVVKHLVGHPAGNVLLVGNSGSGKTTLMRAVEQFLAHRADLASFSNVIRVNANLLAEEHGGRGRAVLGRLYANAEKVLGPSAPMEKKLERVERGIVFVDEVDKIRAHVGGSSNSRGILAQEALLTLMENEEVEFVVPGRADAVRLNTSSILFVGGGAFEEMYDAVLHRALLGKDGPPIQPVVTVSQTGEAREELPFHLRHFLRYEDLFDYGMTPQFISRFESIVVLNDLGEADLAKIFIEPEKSIFRTSREYFHRFGVDLQITRGAIRLIAWDASRQKRLGARALRDIWRRIIRDVEFDPSKVGAAQEAGKAAALTIDEEMVKRAVASRDSRRDPDRREGMARTTR